jgi:hypothetical protein
MKNLFSRFGGSAIIIGKGKASDKNLPEDQSIEYMLENKAIQMNGYSYLSSYQMQPEFMGEYANLPKNGVKLAEIDHEFNEVILQYEVRVSSIVYIIKTHYSNVFAVFIKTDPRNQNGKFFCEIYDNKFLHYRAGGNWEKRNMNIHMGLTIKLRNLLLN